MPLSAVERKVLNCIQDGIPLEPQPFKILSCRLGIKEEEFLQEVKKLKTRGVIRSLAAGLNHKKLGFKSTLLAIKVPLNKLDAVVKKIIVYPEVTHCFLRQNKFNLWTVLIYKDGMLKSFLDKLANEVGKQNILNLPTKKQFKLKTGLRL